MNVKVPLSKEERFEKNMESFKHLETFIDAKGFL